MRTVRARRPSRGTLRRGLLVCVAFAIVLMHSVIAHGMTERHHSAGAEHVSMAVMDSARDTIDGPSMHSSGDCDLHEHPCVFLRADDPVVIALAVLVLAWGFPIPPLLRSIRARLINRSGRPPPWAMPTHLQLQVIRC